MVATLLALAITAAFSQVSWNVTAGMNMMNWTPIDNADLKVGGYAGVGMQYSFARIWSLQPSLLFVNKGARMENKDEGVKAVASPKYLELPVLVGWHLPLRAKGQAFVIKFGPYFAYGLGGNLSFEGYDAQIGRVKRKWPLFKKQKLDKDGNPTEDSGLGAKRFDVGLKVGVAYEFHRFFVEASGEVGLTDLYKYEEGFDTTTYVSNVGLSIGVGFKF